MAQESSIGNLLQLMQLFSGKGETKSTSGGTTTKQTMLSQDVLNAILKSGLEGNQGLASVASGEKTAGLYNSSTNQMLTNDLLARLTRETAVAGAPTVTTTPKQEIVATTPKIGMGGMAGMMGLGMVKNQLDPLLKNKKLTDLLPSMEKSAALSGTGGESQAFAEAGMPVASAFAVNTGENAEAVQKVGEVVASSLTDVLGSGGGGEDFLTALSSLGADSGAALSQAITDNAAALGEAAWSGGASGAASTAGDWCFLTTAVCDYQGKEDNCYELTVLRNFRDNWLKENHPEAIEEYYENAPAIVQKIKEKPEHGYLFDTMYERYIIPAIRHIEEEQYRTAYYIYRQLYNFCRAV